MVRGSRECFLDGTTIELELGPSWTTRKKDFFFFFKRCERVDQLEFQGGPVVMEMLRQK